MAAFTRAIQLDMTNVRRSTNWHCAGDANGSTVSMTNGLELRTGWATTIGGP